MTIPTHVAVMDGDTVLEAFPLVAQGFKSEKGWATSVVGGKTRGVTGKRFYLRAAVLPVSTPASTSGTPASLGLTAEEVEQARMFIAMLRKVK